VVIVLIGSVLQAAPVVSNLTAAQRVGTKLVDITYDLAAPGFGAVAVTLEASSDGGVTWTVPVTSVTGAVGAGVTPGTGKTIVWNAGVDWPLQFSDTMGFRITVDDGFALISGGSFTMGVTSGDVDSTAPSITVTVGSFYLQERETTKAQWDEVRTWAVNNGYTDLAVGAGKAANHPVQTVSWWDVVKWCNARSEKEGLTPVYTVSGAVMRTGTTGPTVNWSANGYRLPTEAEWEKAARGGVSGKRFPWGTDTISHAQANYYGSSSYAYDQSLINNYQPSYNDGVFPYTSPVESFGANEYGLYDMSGNVWEWCWDWYGGSYYTTSNGTTEPRGPASGTSRVYRGGSWLNVALSARCAFRSGITPGFTSNSVGFRPACSAISSQGTTYTSVDTFTLSTNADLSALTLSSGPLSPTFVSAATAYTASVSNATTSLTVTPTRAEACATIEARVNTGTYSAVTSGSPSALLPLNVGRNTVDVRVTAEDESIQKTYTVIVTRMVSTDGLVAYYPFNGNAQDESGNNRHGSVVGPMLAADRFGATERAYFFDGVNDHIIVSSRLTSGNPFTWCAWIKPSNSLITQTSSYILSQQNSSTQISPIFGFNYPNGKIHFFSYTNAL
jgi:formylglycine-generating enzyme required for sulfatase activity